MSPWVGQQWRLLLRLLDSLWGGMFFMRQFDLFILLDKLYCNCRKMRMSLTFFCYHIKSVLILLFTLQLLLDMQQ